MLNQHQTLRDLIAKYNKPNPLADFLLPFVGDKKDIKIADIGSGPFSVIGSYLDGVKVEITHSDKQDFTKWWEKYNAKSIISVEYQNMEKLSYPDNSFDIVTCINALDHTADAPQAVYEMIRVCKPGGWIYIDCWLDQLTTGHLHYWNAKEDGVFVNNDIKFDLREDGFNIKFIDKGGEPRYNQIIATLQK